MPLNLLAAADDLVVYNDVTMRFHVLQNQDADTDALTPGLIRAIDARAVGVPESVLRPSSDSNFHTQLTKPRAVARLMVANTYDCNMVCTYCYNELDTKFASGKGSRSISDPERTHHKVLSWLRCADRGTRRDVTYVGGEPLFAKGELMKNIVELRTVAIERDIALSIGIYTNGLSMDRRFVDWCSEQSVSVVVSLDGPPREHDAHRRTLGGSGSARRILANVRYLIESGHSAVKGVRCVVHTDTDMLDLYRYLLALGFNEIHLQPAYDESGTPFSPKADTIRRVNSWYVELLSSGTVVDIGPTAKEITRIARRGSSVVNHLPCDVGLLSAALDDRGTYFPCHHFFGEPEYAYSGQDDESGPAADERSGRFQPVSERENCSSCWARMLCGGECYHRAVTAGEAYTGVVRSSCGSRREAAALSLLLFDQILRTCPDPLRALLCGELTIPIVDAEAYGCESLDDFRSLRGTIA